MACGWQTEQEIIADFPELEREDFVAVYDYASKLGRRVGL
jgi:uncharacterized protein (DUF433 family)